MMLCQICKANPATIHIQEIVNDETNTLHICAECAKKRNLAEGNAANSHFHEMLERLTQAIANRMIPGQLLKGMLPHPTYEEALTEALEKLDKLLGGL